MKNKIKTIALMTLGVIALASCEGKTPSASTSQPTTIDPITSTPVTDPVTSQPTTTEEPIVLYNVNVINALTGKTIFQFDVEEGTKLRTFLTQNISRFGYVLDDIYLDIDGDVSLPNKTAIEEDMTVYVSYSEDLDVDYDTVMDYSVEESEKTGYGYLSDFDENHLYNFNAGGFIKEMPNFSQYVGTNAYVEVTTATELIEALENAKIGYETTYHLEPSLYISDEAEAKLSALSEASVELSDTPLNTEEDLIDELERLNAKRDIGNYNETTCPNGITKQENTFRVELEKYVNNYINTYITQKLDPEAPKPTVHVIEIMNDIDLGYYNLDNYSKNSSITENYSQKQQDYMDNGTAKFSISSMLSENGITKIKVSNTNELLIYSKNGAKLTHAGFSVESCDQVAFRNIEMDEIWQWEDSPYENPGFKVGDMDVFGWAYFKISFSTNIWIDHCTFGKAYDGVLDVSNPYFYSYGTAFRAPYGVPEYFTEELGGVHISNCEFLSGSDDPNGYLYQMMEEIEEDYQKSLTDTTYQCKYLYYKTLRDVCGLSFDDILYGIAIPQKKAFLWGDSGDSYYYNIHLKVSLANSHIKNIEDRLPNVRGGIAILYNNIFDNSGYYEYYQRLRGITFTYNGTKYTSVVSINNINSNYKCGMVSQGIIGGYNASIYAENTVYIGVTELTKNNNSSSDVTAEQLVAGYMFSNVLVSQLADGEFVVKSTDTMPPTIGNMSTGYFYWHNSSDTMPFDIKTYDITTLKSELYNVLKIGTNSNIDDLYLYSFIEDYDE